MTYSVSPDKQNSATGKKAWERKLWENNYKNTHSHISYYGNLFKKENAAITKYVCFLLYDLIDRVCIVQDNHTVAAASNGTFPAPPSCTQG
jgi:hypothetical protein